MAACGQDINHCVQVNTHGAQCCLSRSPHHPCCVVLCVVCGVGGVVRQVVSVDVDQGYWIVKNEWYGCRAFSPLPTCLPAVPSLLTTRLFLLLLFSPSFFKGAPVGPQRLHPPADRPQHLRHHRHRHVHHRGARGHQYHRHHQQQQHSQRRHNGRMTTGVTVVCRT